MNNTVLRSVSLRGIAFSAVFVVVGIVITFIGVRESVLYHSEPVSAEELQSSFEDDTRVKLSCYRVAGVFDMPGYSYFIIEYSEGNYCLVETTKDEYFYLQLTGDEDDILIDIDMNRPTSSVYSWYRPENLPDRADDCNVLLVVY